MEVEREVSESSFSHSKPAACVDRVQVIRDIFGYFSSFSESMVPVSIQDQGTEAEPMRRGLSREDWKRGEKERKAVEPPILYSGHHKDSRILLETTLLSSPKRVNTLYMLDASNRTSSLICCCGRQQNRDVIA